MKARLAELDAVALDGADPEPLADEVVQADAADRQLAPRPTWGQADVLDTLFLDERQGVPRRHALRVEVAVAVEPFARHRTHRLDGPELTLARLAEMDRDDRHAAKPAFRSSAVSLTMRIRVIRPSPTVKC